MIKKAIYLGVLFASGWKFLKAMQAYKAVGRKHEVKEAIRTWEGEGGNPAGTRRSKQA